MTVSLVFLTALVAAQSYPTYRLLAAVGWGRELTSSFWVAAGITVGGTFAVTALLSFAVLRRGARAIEAREY